MASLRHLIPALLSLMLFAACSDDYDRPDMSRNDDAGNLSLYLNIPSSRVEGEYNVVYPGSPAECHVNDLRIFGFPVGNGQFFTEQLEPNGADFPTDEQFRNYNLEITPGQYRIYVVANMESDVERITTEDELRRVIINYKNNNLPQAGNLPMIHEPREVVNIEKSSSITRCVADLQFTCVKVDLNLVFDRDDAETAASFGIENLTVTAVNGKSLSEKTWLVWGGNHDDNRQRGSMDVDGCTTGTYYTEWLDEPDNAGKSGKRIITPLTAGENNDRWLYHATLYLPERYVESNDDQSSLTVEASLSSGAKTRYYIPLGHTGDAGETTRVLPRSTYYEIVGRIKSLGDVDLDLFVKVEDWTPLDMMAEFIHTTLAVSKTSASVTSVETDFITYETNFPETVRLGWNSDDEFDGESLIVEAYHDRDAHRIGFRVNPRIPIDKFGDGPGLIPTKGTSKVYISAGNIKKYIDVAYEVSPLFEVTPLEEIIQWSVGGGAKLERNISFVTNLGGIIVENEDGERWIISGDGHTDNVGNSNLQIQCDSTAYPKANIKVTAKTDPVTTTEHRFTVRPILDGYRDWAKTVIVRVRPEYTDYRIYFRAINDNQVVFKNVHYASDPNSYQYKMCMPFMGIFPEGTSADWHDGWNSYHADDSYLTVVVHGYTHFHGWHRDGNVDTPFTGVWPGMEMLPVKLSPLYNDTYRCIRFAIPEGKNMNFVLNNNGSAGTVDYLNQRGLFYQDWMNNLLAQPGGVIETTPTTSLHNIYIYSQIGETDGSIPEENVWRFTDPIKGWPGENMQADNTNTGWYYYNLPKDAKGKVSPQYNKPDVDVEPGKTLMIFTNNEASVTSHRCSHHMEPGLSLFDYEDKEGWIVYDPTSASPHYKMFDDIPQIEDVVYTVYTRQEIGVWCNRFGVSENSELPSNQLAMWDIADCVNLNNGWYRTRIKLKAIKGYAEKYLRLKWKIVNNGVIQTIDLYNDDNCIIMFDGNSYESSGFTGYYDGAWHQGRPAGVD